MATPYEAVAQQNATAAIQALMARSRSEAPGYSDQFVRQRAYDYLNSSSATSGMTPLEIQIAREQLGQQGAYTGLTPNQMQQMRQQAEQSMQERATSNVAEYKNDPRYQPQNTATKGYTSTLSANEKAMQDNGSNYDATQGTVFKNVLAKAQSGQPLNPTEKGVLERSGYNINGQPLNGQQPQQSQSGGIASTYYDANGKPAYYSKNTTNNAAQTNTGTTGQNATGSQNVATPAPTNLQAALDILKNSGLPSDVQAIFAEVVKGFDPSKEINIDNIINEFKRVQSTTIDPYFQEMSRIAIDEITRAKTNAEQSRKLEIDTQDINAQQAIEGAQNSLEARGMTFSGEGRRQLGNISAYGKGGEQGNVIQPLQFGSAQEGLVNIGNRLISSSSEARYKQQQEELARNAEKYFGSTGSAGLVPGVQQLGGVTGTLPTDKNAAYASAVMGAAEKEGLNSSYKNPIKYNSNSLTGA